MEILLVNGPNLNLLGTREPEIYGEAKLADIERMVTIAANKQGFRLSCFQANGEGEIIDFLHKHREAAGLIINPGAFTHYSYAIRDCIKALGIPAVEVHISQIYQREALGILGDSTCLHWADQRVGRFWLLIGAAGLDRLSVQRGEEYC